MIRGSTRRATALLNAKNVASFLEAYQKLNPPLSLKELCAKASDGPNKGKSVILTLSMAALNGQPEFFEAVWNKFQNEITIDDLRTKVEDEPHKGSVLWILAMAATTGRSQIFFTVWNKFKDEITIDDLRTKAENGPHKGKSVLWMLAAIATNGRPQVFEGIWEKFKNNITQDDLRAKPEIGPDKEKSAFWLIAYGLLENHQLSLHDTFREVLVRMPSEEKPEGLPSIAELISQYPDVSWRESTLHLMTALNALFAAIKKQQEKVLLENQDIQALSALAKIAASAGYPNAFYDIGLLFFEKKNPEAACIAFQELPPNAKQFTSTHSEAISILLGQAMNEKNDNKRHEHLKAALWFALRLINSKEKLEFLQKVAYCHVTKGKGNDIGVNFFDIDSLMCLNEGSPVESCFELFEELYQLETLKPTQQKNATEEIKSSVESLPVSYTPGFISSAQTQAIPTKIAKEPKALVQSNPPQAR